MNNSYDLTTKNGFEKAVDLFDKYGWLISPLLWGIRKIAKNFKPTIAQQTDAAKKLIKAGKENGVRQLTIKMEREAAARLGGEYHGVRITAGGGSNTSMTVIAHY
jgi:hypothetical protein